MIIVTRLNGPPMALNCDLIERVEATPDTVMTLVDGTKYVVAESVDVVIERVREFRASVISLADVMHAQSHHPTTDRTLRVVPSDEGDS